MPGFRTHYIFGKNTAGRLDFENEALIKHINCYNLGQQGPDVFFFCPPSHIFYREHLGGHMHSSDTMGFFSALLDGRDRFITSDEKMICDAYIMGFMGHYTLDTTVHPYVHYRTRKLSNSHRDNYAFGIHVLLETDMDADILMHFLHKKPSQFHCADTIKLTIKEQAIISLLLSFAICRAYPRLYASSAHVSFAISCLRLAYKLMHDPSGKKKSLLRMLVDEPAIGNAFLSPVIASDTHYTYNDPCNLAHHLWHNPWDEELVSNESVYDLMEQAADDLIRRLGLYRDLMLRHPDNYFYCKNALLADLGNLSYDTGLSLC